MGFSILTQDNVPARRRNAWARSNRFRPAACRGTSPAQTMPAWLGTDEQAHIGGGRLTDPAAPPVSGTGCARNPGPPRTRRGRWSRSCRPRASRWIARQARFPARSLSLACREGAAFSQRPPLLTAIRPRPWRQWRACFHPMKISLNWLLEYVDFAGSPADLAELLTMAGVEVERCRDARRQPGQSRRRPDPRLRAAPQRRPAQCLPGGRRVGPDASAPDRLRREELPGRRQGAARAARRRAARGFQDQGRQAARRGKRRHALFGEGDRRGRGCRRPVDPAARKRASERRSATCFRRTRSSIWRSRQTGRTC